MHLGHKRANSFSSTTAPSKNREDQLLQQPIEHHNPPSIQPRVPPPPTAFIQRNRANSSHQANLLPSKNTYFERRAEERRSFTGHYIPVETTLRATSRPYKGVTIPRATPAAVKFSVNPDIEDWLVSSEMSRPRSPSKSWKNGVNDAGVPSLDHALAAIKEQLAMLKSQRLDISNRVDDFASEIYKTQEHCTTLQRQQHQQAQALSQIGSPGRALRRIKSLESRAHSCTNINKLHCSMDSPDGSSTSVDNDIGLLLPADENIYDLHASPKRKRKTSVPSSIMQTISTNIFQFSPPTNKKVNASFPLRRVSSNHVNNNRRSLQALETIHDNSPSMIYYGKDNEDCGSTDCEGEDTPDGITPASSPRLVRVHSINNIASKPPSITKPLVAPCPSRSSSQTIYSSGNNTTTGFSTLPCRKTSSNSSTVFIDDNLSDSCSIPDVLHGTTAWDHECSSLRSEGSIVFRISSATGQVEKVSSRMVTPTGKRVRTSYSLEKVNAPLLDSNSCASRRAHYLHHQLTTNKTCFSSSSTDNEDMDILTLNEEPRPLSACFESSSTFSIPREVKRTSVLLPSIETTV